MRPSDNRDFAELFGRVEDIERTQAGKGLQFHSGTYGAENVGDWLSVETTGSDSATDGFGAKLALSEGLEVVGGAVVVVGNSAFAYGPLDSAAITLVDEYGSSIQIYSPNGDIGIFADGEARLDSTNFTHIRSDGDVTIDPFGGVDIKPDGNVIIRLAAGQSFTVEDSTNNPVLQWTEGGGDLHIKTGGTVVADL